LLRHIFIFIFTESISQTSVEANTAEAKAAANAKVAAKAKVAAEAKAAADANAAAEAKAAADAKAAAEEKAAAQPKDAEAASVIKSSELPARKSTGQSAIPAKCKGNQDRLFQPGSHGDSFPSKVAKGTASVEQFCWSTLSSDNDFCLSTLESLSHGVHLFDEDETKTEVELLRLLRCRCVALFNFYNNTCFLFLLKEAEDAIRTYGGIESPIVPEVMQTLLRERGFVLTPRMWTKIELACIMVLLIDPHLSYLGIEQKNLSDKQNRYVTCVRYSRACVTLQAGLWLYCHHACRIFCSRDCNVIIVSPKNILSGLQSMVAWPSAVAVAINPFMTGVTWIPHCSGPILLTQARGL
jgi:hypothetical protein